MLAYMCQTCAALVPISCTTTVRHQSNQHDGISAIINAFRLLKGYLIIDMLAARGFSQLPTSRLPQ